MEQPTVDRYREIVGDRIIAQLFRESRPLQGKRILNINSTFRGGGVAEMLWSVIPLMNDLGIDYGWRVIHGSPDFFSVTKKWHNALQGEGIHISPEEKDVYTEINNLFSQFTHIYHDVVIIHDPQPLPLIKYYRKRQPWLWRCHIDLSTPTMNAWDYLKKFILRYDEVVVSSERFSREDLPSEKSLIPPAIDPLDMKNKELNDGEAQQHLNSSGISTDKPIISQISRFDNWKDPFGVIKVFDKVKKEIDCQLVLLGALASDDPEGEGLYRQLLEVTQDRNDITLINKESDMLVNAVQRTSEVVIQKSIREGFGLTVTEALWKGTPVVASNVGGIPLQIKDGETGYLEPPHDYDAFAKRIVNLLQDPEERRTVGARGREFVRERFLITRLMLDWIQELKSILATTRC
ncbi:MAG: glycosyltransferase [Candidatus Acetothermia bacterium]